MATFTEAIKKGVTNANLAAKNLAEIQSVVQELSDALTAASGGLIESVRVQKNSRTIPEGHIFVINPFRPLSGRKEEYSAIAAIPKDKSSIAAVELCEVQLASAGYPVTLAYAKRDVRCHDRAGLEKGIAEMLEHPDTGKLLVPYMPPAT